MRLSCLFPLVFNHSCLWYLCENFSTNVLYHFLSRNSLMKLNFHQCFKIRTVFQYRELCSHAFFLNIYMVKRFFFFTALEEAPQIIRPHMFLGCMYSLIRGKYKNHSSVLHLCNTNFTNGRQLWGFSESAMFLSFLIFNMTIQHEHGPPGAPTLSLPPL